MPFCAEWMVVRGPDSKRDGRGEPVPLRAHQRDDLVDPGLGHAISGLIAGPRRHRPLVGVDVAVGQQVQALVEHLPVELVARQALPAALAEDFQYRPGILHYAYLTVPKNPVTCAPSPCGPALPVSRLAGRYSCDYYGHSVAIGLASRRRSHVQQRYTSERDLGVPFASFNALTGHRSCVPEDTACCCN